jgi:hypothetical protein
MRVLILHESPEADEIAAAFESSAGDFNRGLDIRLRFLDVGFELRRVPVLRESVPALTTLEETLARFRPEVLLVLGRGPRLLECVAAVVKERARDAFLLNGEADRTSQAIARVSDLVVLPEQGPQLPGLPEDRTHTYPPRKPPGRALVDVLVRFGRNR